MCFLYEAKVEVNGIPKKSNGGKSTFFPDEWSSQKVIDSINEAYSNKVYIDKNTFLGKLKNGMEIKMFTNPETGQITSAFPIY
ncbi:EndoU domain-containing protein [Carnobacterium gallinarum]|uniref:EndoU domain-containing protein n=1 Tax=Carnobacterium gallinarum TaxID=2749 RepID=UPI000B22DFEF|nr:EndoU domain-containing protein [Carnobacterium gallinarum]